jgi:hypothetical protein
MNKKIAAYIVIPVLGLALLGGSVALAAPNGTTLAAKSAHQEQLFSSRIAKAVTDKKLTQAQADLIIAKHAEVLAFMQSLNGKSLAERKAAMKTEMASLKQWALDNNIPQNFSMFFGRAHINRGFGHRLFGHLKNK